MIFSLICVFTFRSSEALLKNGAWSKSRCSSRSFLRLPPSSSPIRYTLPWSVPTSCIWGAPAHQIRSRRPKAESSTLETFGHEPRHRMAPWAPCRLAELWKVPVDVLCPPNSSSSFWQQKICFKINNLLDKCLQEIESMLSQCCPKAFHCIVFSSDYS